MKLDVRNYYKYLVYFFAFLSVVILGLSNFVVYPLKYTYEINKYATTYNVSPALIASVIKTESDFNLQAVSSKGAIGLMQLMPKTAQWLCEKINLNYDRQKLFSADFNIHLGTYYLSYLFKRFLEKDTVVVAYNSGEGNVSEWLKNNEYSPNGTKLSVIPYKESSEYLKKVKMAENVYKHRI